MSRLDTPFASNSDAWMRGDGASPVLWHGSHSRFETFEDRSVLTRLYAHWTTTDPVLAALYAGPHGWVHPVSLAHGAAMLDASGWPGAHPLHPLCEPDIESLALECAALNIPMLDDDETFGDSERNMALSLRPGYGGRGPVPRVVSWEGIVQEHEHDCEKMNALLARMNFDAVLCVDPLPGILGDLGHHATGTRSSRDREAGPVMSRPHEGWFRQEAEALAMLELAGRF